MSEIIIPKRRMERRGTAADLAVLNEVLLAGEWCLETDTRKVKFGDGVTAYNALLYVGELANLGNPVGDRLVYWDDAAQAFAFLKLGTGLAIGSGGDLDATGGASGQAAVQFKDEGSNVGASGAITSVDFVGSGIAATVVGTALTVTASGGGGGPTLIASDTLVSAGTTLTIATGSFNLSTSKRLRVVLKAKNNTASDAGYVQLYMNTDTTSTNYRTQLLVALGGASGAATNDASLLYQYASALLSAEVSLSLDFDGKAEMLVRARSGVNTAPVTYASVITYATATNVTGLKVVAPANMAIGSTLEVWSW